MTFYYNLFAILFKYKRLILIINRIEILKFLNLIYESLKNIRVISTIFISSNIELFYIIKYYRY